MEAFGAEVLVDDREVLVAGLEAALEFFVLHDEPRVAHAVSDDGHELLVLPWLGDVALDASAVDGGVDRFKVAHARDHDLIGVFEAVALLLKKVNPRHPRHPVVDGDDVEGLLGDGLDGSFRLRKAGDVEPFA